MNSLQKFCVARSVKLHAEQEELKHRDEVLRMMQAKKKPVVVRADGRTFLVSLDREKYLNVVEVEDLQPAQEAAEPVAKPAPKAAKKPVQATTTPHQQIAVACSKTFAKAVTQAARDEGWSRSEWAESVIPEAFCAWAEDGVLCEDPKAGDSQVVVALSEEVFAQLEEVGKAMGGRGAAFRRLIAYSLPNGGTP